MFHRPADGPQPTLDACLAYVALAEPDGWLRERSPTALMAFLCGAGMRASLVEPAFPQWRIWGPLTLAAFDRPLLERTGRPNLSIRWATALELLYLGLPDALEELRELVRRWFEERGFDPSVKAGGGGAFGSALGDPRDGALWSSIARRPAMYFGNSTGRGLEHFLSGMSRGGNWLGLPPIASLRQLVETIETASEAAYGSPFGAYRVCDAGELLAMAGVVAD